MPILKTKIQKKTNNKKYANGILSDFSRFYLNYSVIDNYKINLRNLDRDIKTCKYLKN